jgi:hypothetical protein
MNGALSAVGSPTRAGTVCPKFHLMFALTHFPIRTSTCSFRYIEYYLDSYYYSRSTSYSHITQLLPWLTRSVQLRIWNLIYLGCGNEESKPKLEIGCGIISTFFPPRGRISPARLPDATTRGLGWPPACCVAQLTSCDWLVDANAAVLHRYILVSVSLAD